MLTLLRDLRRLHKMIDLPQPGRGRSLAIRHVDAGSCNGCEHELTQLSNPYYDLQRFRLGIAEDLIGPVEAIVPIDLRIPGCPPTPEAIAEALLGLIDRGSAATPTK